MEALKNEGVQVGLSVFGMFAWMGLGFLVGYEMIFLCILCFIVFNLMAIGGFSVWMETRANRPKPAPAEKK